MAKSSAKWADYERLAHKIMKELMPYAAVTLDDHLYGNETEGPREIDVTAWWAQEGKNFVLIVQLKDFGTSKASITHVGAFKSDMQDGQATQSVMIWSGGFSARAKTYARNIGIELMSLHDAESVHWNRNLTIPFVWKETLP